MNFLSPAAIAIAAGLTIPPLVALYFLKLKRTLRRVPSTMLWKKAVEDLQVNAPFQRLRKSLLLLLQLLVLAAAALALGKPMFQVAKPQEDTLILLVDQSASMAVLEQSGKTRLDLAKEQAKRCIDNMNEHARAMILAFCDRATVVSSFDSDKAALRRKVDSIEQTQSTTSLAEALNLAEAYAHNEIIGGERPGTDVVPASNAPPATVYVITDGKVDDAARLSMQNLTTASMRVISIGSRSDNVGITAMAAARNYETPELLEVTASVRNFGDAAKTLDVVLYVDGRNADIKTVELPPSVSKVANPTSAVVGSASDVANETSGTMGAKSPSSTSDLIGEKLIAFDQVEFAGGGVIEVVLQIQDALPADDRAWTIIEPPHKVRVLLVSDGDFILENVIRNLDVEVVTMKPAQYEAADDKQIAEDGRSIFDVVVFDRHSTLRLPQGNYMFFGAIPKIERVTAGSPVNDEVIFDWDETHPILRHVTVETIEVSQWLRLTLPADAISIMRGQTSPVLGYFSRKASQFLVCAFSLVVTNDTGQPMLNTLWGSSPHFIVFMQNAIQYLSSNIATKSKKSIAPGEPVTLPAPPKVELVTITRPDGTTETTSPAASQSIHYGATREVGLYKVSPGVPGDDTFAVNMFNRTESDVAPATLLNIGTEKVGMAGAAVPVNRPAWKYFLLGVLILLLLEWIVYNRRVFV
ncbi:MAG: VWA domain-containing protein [Planctomycetes bacterium]|nr:VWA domain-containing protein [Planctomycetota bacterium]MBI3832736.1 VWA domain-containing protein [Planctomycetota bacterium]